MPSSPQWSYRSEKMGIGKIFTSLLEQMKLTWSVLRYSFSSVFFPYKYSDFKARIT